MKLAIPKIDVTADVAYMGLTTSGDMEAPKTNEDAGWYKYGPHPGNPGSAVIAGHLGVGSNAIFAQLNLLAKGDIVSVSDDRGQTVSFRVTHVRTYAYDTEPSEVFKSASGAHLNLITCNGDWDVAKRTYSERLVVFTDKV
ncbi:MAG: class F sortase [Candidatus Saccharimonas sp.]